jgi:tripartite-type tricarboxylate transporter receptor subunit TctC
MRFTRLLALTVYALLPLSNLHAQDFPGKRLSIVVPFPAGSPADVRARIIATQLSARVKQPVIVDNRPGASGNIATQLVARAKPDGYTMLYANNGQLVINPHLYANPGFDGVKDFVPVTQLVLIPWVLVANANLPVKSVAELIALAKERPGKLSYASSGIGTPQHVLGEQFEKVAGIDMLHVPYKGENLSVNDLLNGQVATLFGTPVSTLPLIKANKVKVLGVSAVKRIRSLPDVPLLSETLPGFTTMGWAVIAVPAATPADIVATLNKHITQIMLLPEIKDKEEAAGYEVLANTPQQAAAAIKEESARYAKLIAELKLRVE